MMNVTAKCGKCVFGEMCGRRENAEKQVELIAKILDRPLEAEISCDKYREEVDIDLHLFKGRRFYDCRV